MSQAREILEQLQECRRLARLELARDLGPLGAQLAHEASLYRAALQRNERAERRSTSQRVAMFGFLLLFVGPIAAMFGTALGRMIHGEPWVAASCLGVGLISVGVLVVPTLTVRLFHTASPRWRLLERALELSQRL